MNTHPDPTDPKREMQIGRIALWLDPDDIRFIADEWRKIPEGVSSDAQERWSRIAFRASAALHKAGLDYQPQFPGDAERYKS